MTAVTVDYRYDGVMAHEYVSIDITEGYTYTSKLSAPIGCIVTPREDIDAYVNYTLSGQTFTFHEAGTAGIKVFVHIVGRL